jgi:hypothetical protein
LAAISEPLRLNFWFRRNLGSIWVWRKGGSDQHELESEREALTHPLGGAVAVARRLLDACVAENESLSRRRRDCQPASQNPDLCLAASQPQRVQGGAEAARAAGGCTQEWKRRGERAVLVRLVALVVARVVLALRHCGLHGLTRVQSLEKGESNEEDARTVSVLQSRPPMRSSLPHLLQMKKSSF